MHNVIAGVHFNQCAISLAKLADWGSTGSHPVGLIEDNLMKCTSAPKFWTVGFLMVKLLLVSLNSWDHDYSSRFTMKSASMGCPRPGRSTVMEMWSYLSELSHCSFPFCHHRFMAISTLAWSHYSGKYCGHTIELILGGRPPTAACVAPFRLSCPVQPSHCSRLCRSPIRRIQEVDSWFFLHRR